MPINSIYLHWKNLRGDDMIYKIMSFFLTLFLSLGIIPPLSEVTPVNPADDPVTSVSEEFTIMTYNVKVSGVGKYKPETRSEYVIDTVMKNYPDSVGFQEVSEDWYSWLKEGLDGYDFRGEARNSDGTGEASPVFFRADKYECVDYDTFWLSETPDTPSKGWDAMYNRVCTYVILEEKSIGFTYAHFNAHFDHIGSQARNESVSLITSVIARVCPDIPVLFTGDLNDEEGSIMYGRILDSGLKDIKYEASDSADMGTFHGYSKITEASRKKPIDFVFANAYCKSASSYEVLTEKYNGIYSSDHHPVKTVITLSN